MQASRKKVYIKWMNEWMKKRSVSTLRNDINKIMNGHTQNVKSQNAKQWNVVTFEIRPRL